VPPGEMMTADDKMSAEDRLIARFFKPLATHPGALGLSDDAAFLSPPPGCDLVLKTDAIVGGVHFFPDDAAHDVARKALRVNLSDLAAKGARPLGFLLSLALPAETADEWLDLPKGFVPMRRCSAARCLAETPFARSDRSRFRSP
jgi:thiamine-monophosphate kinase